MIILGIETSCDDTGIAIVKVAPTKVGVVFNILSNTISSQIKTHAPFGGVIPNLAAREHLKNIEPCLKTALKEADKTIKEIDLIAVTIGPGLIPSLLIGVNFAKALAYKYNIPIIGINHIEAHIIAALAATNPKSPARLASQREAGRQILNPKQLFPAVALTVSGGHTQLVLVKDTEKYKILGETRDDAAGECFDKVAKLLKLGYPGGPIISKMAAGAGTANFHLPRPMISHKNYDFSFSGLKTAVLYTIRDMKKINIPEMCRETQQAIIDVLIDKTLRAAKEYKAKTIILAGGVAANEELRKQFSSKLQTTNYKLLKFLVPPKNLCTDNGAMIAMAGYYNRKKTCPAVAKQLSGILANSNLRLS